jgi:hypothetical protein
MPCIYGVYQCRKRLLHRSCLPYLVSRPHQARATAIRPKVHVGTGPGDLNRLRGNTAGGFSRPCSYKSTLRCSLPASDAPRLCLQLIGLPAEVETYWLSCCYEISVTLHRDLRADDGKDNVAE